MSMFLALAPASFAGLSKHCTTVRTLAAFKYWLKDTFNNPSFLDGWVTEMGRPTDLGALKLSSMTCFVWTISFLGPSMLLLTTGMFVFCWTEQPRAVAHVAALRLDTAHFEWSYSLQIRSDCPMPPLKTREVMMRKNPSNDLVGDDVHGHRVRVVSTIFNDNPRGLAC